MKLQALQQVLISLKENVNALYKYMRVLGYLLL